MAMAGGACDNHNDFLFPPFQVITMRRNVACLSFLLATTFLPIARASEPSLADVIRSTPKPSNAIMHLDLNALRTLTQGTPLEMDLPSRLDRIRIASEIDLARLQPAWEIGYATMKSIPSADMVARMTGGYVDQVANREVVWTPNQMYLVPLPDRVLSIVRPSDRRFLSQWLRRDRNTSQSDYLLNAAETQLDGLSVMIAIDLDDVISEQTLAENLADFDSMKGKRIASIAKNLAGIRGVTFSVSKDSLSMSSVRISFREAPTEILPIAKEFFGELLKRRGSSLGDLSGWKVSLADTTTLAFTGPMTPAVLDDVLGVFTLQRQPSRIEVEPQPESASKETSASVIADNTRNYFRKVVSMVHRVRDYSASNTGERAQWNGHMANRIDELPTLNVDSEMVDFGAEVAKALRNNMASMQLTNIAMGAQAVANNAGVGGFSTATGAGTIAGHGGAFGAMGGYGFGGNFHDPNSPVRYFQAGQAQGNAGFRQMIAQLEQAISDMRRRMTTKYGIQF